MRRVSYIKGRSLFEEAFFALAASISTLVATVAKD
jgi:hypothetical protein